MESQGLYFAFVSALLLVLFSSAKANPVSTAEFNNVVDALRLFQVPHQGVTSIPGPANSSTVWRIRPKMPLLRLDPEQTSYLQQNINGALTLYMVAKQMAGSSGTLICISQNRTIVLSVTSILGSQQLKVRYLTKSGVGGNVVLPSPFQDPNEYSNFFLIIQTNYVVLFMGCNEPVVVQLDEAADLRIDAGSMFYLYQTSRGRNKFNGWIQEYKILPTENIDLLWVCTERRAQDGGTLQDLLPFLQVRVAQVESQSSSSTDLELCAARVTSMEQSVSELNRMLDRLKTENVALRGQLSLLETCDCKVQACIYNSKVYENSQQWYKDPCTLCTCHEGETECIVLLDHPQCRNPCASSPCLNGGTCLGFPGFENYTCQCPPTCGGSRCQHLLNVCTYQAAYGECDGRMLRYHYNSFLQRCVEFVYSGCGGNANNFLSHQTCQDQCLVGACCHRSFVREVAGDDYNAFTRLLPGFRCEELTLAECRLRGVINPVFSRREEVTAFHPSMSCEEVQCQLPNGCVIDGIEYDVGQEFTKGCERCHCSTGGITTCSCTTLSVRKEIRDMTQEELDQFHIAVQQLRLPGTDNPWEMFRDQYMTHIMEAHNSPSFLLWHRVFLREVEMKLQEIDCSLTIPYFDFTTDSHDLSSAIIWQPNYFGGDGGGDCVPDHPFRSNIPWSPCLIRHFHTTYAIPSKLDVATAMASNDFSAFSECLQMIIGHIFSHVGGHIASSAAPYDPVFYVFHAYIDKLFTEWLDKPGNSASFPSFLLNVPLIPFNINPRVALQSVAEICVTYVAPREGAPCNDTGPEFNIFGFNADGFDRNGYNRLGYDKYGFNANGYDIFGQLDNRQVYHIDEGYTFEGFNRSGYDRRGYNRYGYSTQGFNRDGFDIYGYNPNGYDRYGFDQDGFDRRGYSPLGYDRSNYYDQSSIYNREGYSFQCLDRRGLNPSDNDQFGFNEGFVDENYCNFTSEGPFAPYISWRLDSLLFQQSPEFLKSYTRTCGIPSRDPLLWYEQTWTSRLKPLPRGQIAATHFEDSPYSRRFCFDVEPLLTYCPCDEPIGRCTENPCNRACGSHRDAVCYINFCGGCTAVWYHDGEPVNCGLNIRDCNDGVNTYPEGSVWRPDPCTTCRCALGAVDCEVADCPRPSCTHPSHTEGDCCSTCDSCQYGELVYENGRTFNSVNDQCMECTCNNGNVNCGSVACPPVTCSHPWTYGDSCCPVCNGCEYEGSVLRNGQAFSHDTCTMCRCTNGNVICDPIQCLELSCTNQIYPQGSCCPHCRDGCEYEGMSFNNGDYFTPMSNPCLECSCRDSIVRCHPLPCAPPPCTNPIFLLGACCPICTNKCVHDGKQYDTGATWLTVDKCEECSCEGSQVNCRPASECPQQCDHGIIRQGQCCSDCTECRFNGKVWNNFAEFPTSDGCEYCSCYYGTVTCRNRPCRPLQCKVTFQDPGTCCPRCLGCSDRFGNQYAYGETWFSDLDSCQECICEEGQITCTGVRCEIECTDPIYRRGSCCPECDDCYYEGSEYQNGGAVYSRDPCVSCACNDGSVTCTTYHCPRLPCPRPVSVPGQCCKVCPTTDCGYEGQTYSNGEQWIPDSDACLQCRCRSGEVSCNRLDVLCSNACQHPVHMSGQCCPVCLDCEYSGQTIANGGSFRDPRNACNMCSCHFGTVLCEPERCEPVICANPIIPSGECCPTCTTCFAEGNEYSEGSTWASSRDSCVTCRCTSGQAVCERAECPSFLPCTHPVRSADSCCPECDNCMYDRRFFTNGQQFTDPLDECSVCECRSGTVLCEPERCEPVICANPVIPSGECCPTCTTCFAEGNEYSEGSTWVSSRDSCVTCRCTSGQAVCEQAECPSFLPCTHPVRSADSCCPECDNCMYDRRFFTNGQQFTDPLDECSVCECRSGTVLCEPERCEPVICANPVILSGECCPTCTTCFAEGNEYSEGSTWASSRDSCVTCRCTNGQAVCERAECPSILPCTHPVRSADSCCPECDNCMYDRRFFTNGQRSMDPLDECSVCECRDGNMLCEPRRCPRLMCSQTVTLEGECCPRCAVCDFEGQTYQDAEVFQSSRDPCVECECRSGRVGCGRVACPHADCTYPGQGQCCRVCEGCLYRGLLVGNGREFENPIDECSMCICQTGEISCRDVECRMETTTSVQTTASSNVCIHHGRVYDDGEVFQNALNDCVDCVCRAGVEQCQPRDCPAVSCQFPRYVDCCYICEDCEYLGISYQPGTYFVKPDDPCQNCTCQNSQLVCEVMVCRIIPPGCQDVSERKEGECCRYCRDDVDPRPPLRLESCMMNDGTEYESGATFTHSQYACRQCDCINGNVNCTHVDCPGPLQCSDPIIENCCPSCNGCYFNGSNYALGSVFADPADNCANCRCQGGNVFCLKVPCPALSCPHQRQPEGRCCPECYDVDCTYGRVARDHGSSFPHLQDQCQECYCDDGAVTCRVLPCEAPQCPYPVAGPCCSTCNGCLYNGQEFNTGQSFEDPFLPCQVCECQDGFISCEALECTDPPCSDPVKLSGECCPSCIGCYFGQRSYNSGDSFGNPDNKCQMCDCLFGNVTCEKARCPFAACEYPTNDDCGCPICDGCTYRGIDYRDGNSFQDPQDSCRECTCRGGYIECEDVSCPRPRCFHPVLEPGQCCPTCNNCEYDESVYQNRQEFRDTVDVCRVCTCLNGDVNCAKQVCDAVSCTNPMMDRCNCPECDGCMYEDIMAQSGDIFSDPNNHCQDCLCLEGNVACMSRDCPSVNCTSPTLMPGECCPVCLEPECEDEPDPCGTCECLEGEWQCETNPCPVPRCTHPGQGMCCLQCDGCTFGGKPWANGNIFLDPSDSCGECQCIDGFVRCQEPECPEVDCPRPVIPAGQCCPVCIGRCTVDGVTYENGEDFVPSTDRCQRCNCRNGQVFCSAVECSRLCGHPQEVQGQCCPVCDGCSFEGTDYNNGAAFTSAVNSCHECRCLNGNIQCTETQCPDLACPNPVHEVGDCCPHCLECTYRDRTYSDGATWTAHNNQCIQCECQGSDVACDHVPCPNSGCTHPVQGACCPLCASCLFEEVVYNSRQTFRPDNCRECNCLRGNVICNQQQCPQLTCQNRVTDPGECCERCQGCLYEGFEYESGESWVSPLNPCLTCQCQDGTTVCSEVRCLTADFCANPIDVPGQCCSVCPGCVFNGVTYEDNQSFSPHNDPCETCVCQGSSLTCVREACPNLSSCPQGQIQPPSVDQCCGACTGDLQVPTCEAELIGSSYQPYSDPCHVCTCSNSTVWECMQTMCPMLMCPRSERFREVGECCPKCQRCLEEETGLTFFTGSTWRRSDSNCIICTCDFGAINCKLELCEPIECEEGFESYKPTESCCLECRTTQLPCYYQAIQYKSGQQWTRDDCTSCECVSGEVQCITSRCSPLFCDSDEQPTSDPGSCCPRCIPRLATCIAFGDPHYRTFDGKVIHFQGTCRYVMAMDCTNQDFIVEVKNDDRGRVGSVSWTEEVSIIIGSTQVVLGQSGIVKVNQEIVIAPFRKDNILNIERRGEGYYVNTNVGLKVQWDGKSFVEVSIPKSYAGQMCGLCGNFNGFPQDDLRTRSGQVVMSVAAFGNSWTLPGLDSANCDAKDLDPCDEAGYTARKLANIKCASMKSPRFASCHRAVPPGPYYQSCVYDLCACPTGDSCLCEALAAYAAECRQVGININWRNEALCAVNCPKERGLVFDECGPACPRTCTNKDIPFSLISEQCLKPCVPGCHCTADKVLHSGSCIDGDACPADYRVNATIVELHSMN